MRLCTLNVPLWGDARGRSNVDRVIDLLRALDCDVVALQEVLHDGPHLQRVADALGMHHALGAEAWLGNALLSAHPLDAVEAAPITSGYEEGRCALVASVRLPEGSVEVCSTHLDPGYEVTRLRQLERFAAAMARRPPDRVVMGDFNALRLADYTPAAIEAVRAARAASDREEPRGDVTARMDALGYVDLYRLARAPDLAGYYEALSAPLPEGACATCWASTRIDYAWASASLIERHAVMRAELVETDATDHKAIVVELAGVRAR